MFWGSDEIFAVPFGVKYAILGFRVNCEGADPFDVEISFPSITNQTLSEVSNDRIESYDDIFDYNELYAKYDLEKDFLFSFIFR